MSESLQVAVRVRPLNEKERSSSQSEAVTTFGKVVSVRDSDQAFSFTDVYGVSSTQEEVFSKSVKPLLENLFKGYNLTILAYGQTGSGKTYTMGTSGGEGRDAGMILKSIQYIFDRIELSTDCEINVSVSFLELYMEEFRDLLASTHLGSNSPLDIREDGTGNIIVPGLTEIAVSNPEETLSWLAQGSQFRKTGATAMNVVSSRSHAVFTIKLECNHLDGSPATVSKFSLVDLAGSERAKKTGTTGERMQEGIDINKGLLALGNVISALSEQKRGRHIPYRDSKLTRLLQDSLGGNSHTLMIACVSPAAGNLQETVSTLRYATRALKIKNKPVVNADLKAAEISELQTQLKNLRNLLEQEKMMKGRQMCPPGHLKLISLVKQAISDDSNETLSDRIKNMSPMTKDYLRHIGIVVDDMEDEDFEVYHSLSPTHFQPDGAQSPIENVSHAEAEEGYEQHQKQLNLELQGIESELETKEAQMKELSNMSLIEYEEKCISLQQKVEELQMQKVSLEKQLVELQGSNSKASAMLAEQRRQQIKELERKINLQNKELAEISRLRVEKKRDGDRINTLQRDIQGLKAAKVKLSKEIRKSADNFRVWKMRQDKEVGRLKEAAVKGKHQLDKQARLHAKQQNVLQRKYEEAMNANKKLQSMLGHQRQNVTFSASHRSMMINNQEKVQKWLHNEIEIEKSKAIHREALDHLLADKDRLVQKKNNLTNTKCWEDPATKRQRTREIRGIERQINTLCKQIADLEKLLAANNMGEGNNPLARWTVVSNLSDARIVMENLMQTFVQSDRELAAKKEQMTEMEDSYSREIKRLKEQLKNTISTPVEAPAASTNLALTPVQPMAAINPSRTFNLDSMVKSKRKTLFFENNDSLDESLSDNDDVERDPDWRKTPFTKQLRTKNSSEFEAPQPTEQKKTSFDGRKCMCSGNCETKRCGCKKLSEQCSENCGCSGEMCRNRLNADNEDEDSHEMLNSTPLNTTFEVKKRSSDESRIKEEEVGNPPEKRKKRMFASVKVDFDF